MDYKLLQQHRFYKPIWKNGAIETIKFQKYYYLEILRQAGFTRYKNSRDSRIFIQIINSIASIVEEEDFVNYFYSYIGKLDPITYTSYNGDVEAQAEVDSQFLQEMFLSNVSNIAKPIIHGLLQPDNEIKFLEDTRTEKFFYYQNAIVRITKENISLIDYSENKNLIWDDGILPRNIKLNENYKNSNFYKFIKNICTIKGSEHKTEERILSLRTILGYAMHGYFLGKLKMPFFTDSTISENSEPNGRTGKSLLVKGIINMLNSGENSRVVCELPAKNINFQNPNRYDRANINTKLMVLNDVQRNYSLENQFNDIADGTEIKKMYKSPFIINTKWLGTANLSIQVNGDSARDRVLFFELSDYYKAGFGPADEFNEWFFSQDWNSESWEAFDNFMFESVQLYLQNGMIEPDAINLEERTLIEHTSRYFVVWFDALISGTYQDGSKVADFDIIETFSLNTPITECRKYSANDLYKRFTEQNKEFEQTRGTIRKFRNWLNQYCKQKNLKLETMHLANGSNYIFYKKE